LKTLIKHSCSSIWISAHTEHLYHSNIQLFSQCCYKGFYYRIWTVYWWVRGHHKLHIKGTSKLILAHTMTAYMRGGGEHHLFLTSARDRREWLASSPGHFNPEEW